MSCNRSDCRYVTDKSTLILFINYLLFAADENRMMREVPTAEGELMLNSMASDIPQLENLPVQPISPKTANSPVKTG